MLIQERIGSVCFLKSLELGNAFRALHIVHFEIGLHLLLVICWRHVEGLGRAFSDTCDAGFTAAFDDAAVDADPCRKKIINPHV